MPPTPKRTRKATKQTAHGDGDPRSSSVKDARPAAPARRPSVRRRRAAAPVAGGDSASPTATAPTPAAVTKESEAAASVCDRTRRWAPLALGMVAMVLVLVWVAAVAGEVQWGRRIRGDGNGRAGQRSPCSCAAEAFAEAAPGSPQRQLAANLLQRGAVAVSGVHAHTGITGPTLTEALAFVKKCGAVQQITDAVANVEQLREVLVAPFGKARCVAWVVEESTIAKVAGALKELLEYNSLRGQAVVPPGSRAMLVLASEKTRERLKDSLPHRVVHMLSSIEMA